MPSGGHKRARKATSTSKTDTCKISWVGDGVLDALGCTTYDAAIVTQPDQAPRTYKAGDDVLVQTAASENVRFYIVSYNCRALHHLRVRAGPASCSSG